MNDERPSGRHPVSIGHLVMGLAFTGILVIWAVVQTDTVTGDDVRWLLPIPWVVAGVAGLIASAVTGTRRHAVRQTGWAGEQQQTEPAYRSPGERLGDLRELKQLSELKHLGDHPTAATEETAPLVTQPEAAAETDQTDQTDQDDEEKKS